MNYPEIIEEPDFEWVRQSRTHSKSELLLNLWITLKELSAPDALGFKNVRQVFDPGEHTAQLGNILDFDHDVQVRQVLGDPHLHIHDIDAFAVEQRGNITH